MTIVKSCFCKAWDPQTGQRYYWCTKCDNECNTDYSYSDNDSSSTDNDPSIDDYYDRELDSVPKAGHGYLIDRSLEKKDESETTTGPRDSGDDASKKDFWDGFFTGIFG